MKFLLFWQAPEMGIVIVAVALYLVTHFCVHNVHHQPLTDHLRFSNIADHPSFPREICEGLNSITQAATMCTLLPDGGNFGYVTWKSRKSERSLWWLARQMWLLEIFLMVQMVFFWLASEMWAVGIVIMFGRWNVVFKMALMVGKLNVSFRGIASEML